MDQLRLDLGDMPKTDWIVPRLSELPSWAEAKRVAIDVETKDPDLRALGPGVRRPDSYVVGFGFSIEDGDDYYIPIRHRDGDNVEGDAWQYFRDQFRDFKGTLVGNGINYDLDWIAEEDCDVLRHPMKDIQVADVLINELHARYDLDALCERYGLPGKDEEVLRRAAHLYGVDPKKELWKLPGRYAAQYGMMDTRRPLQVLRKQEVVIERDELTQIWELEQKVTPILTKMRRRGVRVDLPRVGAIARVAQKKMQEYCDRVKHKTGVTIEPEKLKNASIIAPAVRQQGYKPPLTPKTRKASIDKDFLAKCGEVGKWLNEAREWFTLKNTFCAQVQRFAIGDRVHCTFNQLRNSDDEGKGRGVRYGRFSSTKFNFQQQPVRHDEFGPMWRGVFIADEGARWACSDWSQQEPRIGVHYAEKLGLPGAKDFADAYRADPSLDIHQKLADLSEMPRKIVKNYVNGRLYGMGDAKLCRSIGHRTMMGRSRDGRPREIPGPEGQAIIDKFNKFAPWVQGLTREASRVAKKKGCVWTILRRRCNFEKGPDGKYQFTHKAFNRVGQGSAADQMKATLVACDAEGIPIQAVVHDEFDFSFDDIKVAKRVRELQRDTVKFSVPMKVDLEIGPNWGDLKKVAA